MPPSTSDDWQNKPYRKPSPEVRAANKRFADEVRAAQRILAAKARAKRLGLFATDIHALQPFLTFVWAYILLAALGLAFLAFVMFWGYGWSYTRWWLWDSWFSH